MYDPVYYPLDHQNNSAMKTITFTVDVKSFFLGVLTVGGILLLVNFTPASQHTTLPQPDPYVRRYQAVISERSRTIIIDTQTGRFLIERPSVGLPGWAPMDFEELHKSK